MKTSDKQAIRRGVRAMLERRAAALDGFSSTVADLAGLTKDDGAKIVSVYLRIKILKFDGMSYRVTHGAFLDRDVLRRALDIANG